MTKPLPIQEQLSGRSNPARQALYNAKRRPLRKFSGNKIVSILLNILVTGSLTGQ